MLLGLGASPGTPWRPCWDGDLKNLKKTTFWNLLLGAVLSVFTESEFSMFSEPLFYHLFGPRDAQRGHFWSTLGAKCNTSWISMEKLKLHYRSKKDTTIKLSTFCVSLWFIIFWYVLPRPVMSTFYRMHYSRHAQYMDPFGTQLSIQMHNKYSLYF